MRNNEKLVTIAEFESDFDAELAKITLENAGIESVVFGGDLIANMPTIEPIHIELQVFEADAERAKEVLAKQEPLEDSEGDESNE
jgi:hypothetical protein